MFRDGLDYILGVRPDYDGLIVDPCIPELGRFQGDAQVPWRDLRDRGHQPNHAQHGVASIEMDGQKIDGNMLPLVEPGRTAKVKVVMG